MKEKPKEIQVSYGSNTGVGSVVFKCPSCNEAEIRRTLNERKTAVKYKCPKCEFEGPN